MKEKNTQKAFLNYINFIEKIIGYYKLGNSNNLYFFYKEFIKLIFKNFKDNLFNRTSLIKVLIPNLILLYGVMYLNWKIFNYLFVSFFEFLIIIFLIILLLIRSKKPISFIKIKAKNLAGFIFFVFIQLYFIIFHIFNNSSSF